MTLLTDQAVEVAIDTACRTLRLPTIRERAAQAAATAAREQHTYQGFLAELLLAEIDLLMLHAAHRHLIRGIAPTGGSVVRPVVAFRSLCFLQDLIVKATLFYISPVSQTKTQNPNALWFVHRVFRR